MSVADFLAHKYTSEHSIRNHIMNLQRRHCASLQIPFCFVWNTLTPSEEQCLISRKTQFRYLLCIFLPAVKYILPFMKPCSTWQRQPSGTRYDVLRIAWHSALRKYVVQVSCRYLRFVLFYPNLIRCMIQWAARCELLKNRIMIWQKSTRRILEKHVNLHTA